MSRRKQAKIRDHKPDAIYNSKFVTKTINKLMLDGKKEKAKKILYSAFAIIEKKTEKKPIIIFEQALENIIPQLELKTRRIGGANYQIPVEVTSHRKVILGIRWLVLYSRKRHEKSMAEKLAYEIIDAAKNTGQAVKRKIDTHKMAEANRAFAHYRW